MAEFIIPLEGGAINAHQTIQAQLGDNLAEFELNYINSNQQWAMNMSLNGELAVAGAALVLNADITQSWHIWPTFGRLVVTGVEPTLDNLGTENNLVWIEPDAN